MQLLLLVLYCRAVSKRYTAAHSVPLLLIFCSVAFISVGIMFGCILYLRCLYSPVISTDTTDAALVLGDGGNVQSVVLQAAVAVILRMCCIGRYVDFVLLVVVSSLLHGATGGLYRPVCWWCVFCGCRLRRILYIYIYYCCKIGMKFGDDTQYRLLLTEQSKTVAYRHIPQMATTYRSSGLFVPPVRRPKASIVQCRDMVLV